MKLGRRISVTLLNAKNWRTPFGIMLLVFFITPRLTSAQALTTGSISGSVVDPQGGLLPGVSITATHQPTGTTYEAVTNGEGRFEIFSVRVGGPYRVVAALSGFREQTEAVETVGLGENRTIEFKLTLASVTENVTVTAEVPNIDSTRAGTAANIRSETIENLPSISRSMFDYARTSPFVSLNQDSAGGEQVINVAGRNNRYNNMQIDGAVNNDVFAISSSSTPGSAAGTQPISLDVIQEVQIAISPYDVRQGGFSGGSVNAVTKSGGNAFGGTGYWFQRNQALVGDLPSLTSVANPTSTDTKVGTFSDKQGGFSFGGPIMQNKAFFFGNFDTGRKTTPTGYSLDGASGQPWLHTAEVQQILDIAKNQYGYDAGGLGEVSTPQKNNKYFLRTDYNLGLKHQLTARVNYIDASLQRTTSGIPSNLNYAMPNDYYFQKNTNLGVVGQLNSTFGGGYNEFRIGYNRIRDARELPTPIFPYVQVDLTDGNSVRLGSENSSHANALDQDIVEVTNDFTLVRGNHTLTIGTHNEFFTFWNLFLQNLYGNYRFNNAALFQQGLAQAYSVGFSNAPDTTFAAAFSVRQFGGYFGDQWRVRSNLTLTYGVRVDKPNFPDTPTNNPATVPAFGYATDVVPSPTMWSPRIGFNWDLSGGGEKRSQLRGGVGYFTGRTPYVWLSNQYGGTGVDTTSLSTSNASANRIPFSPDPNNQARTGVAATPSVSLIDPDYKYPAVVRTNLGYDRDLGIYGLIGTAELIYSKNIEEVAYSNINYIPSGTLLPDGRIVYKKKDAAFQDVILLSNTSLGKSWSTAFKIERPFMNGWNFSGSYLYGEADSINDGTASTAGSNWANNPAGYTLDPTLSRSNYDPGSRVNFTAVMPIPLGHGIRSTVSMFYNGQSGRPYSVQFNGNPNDDNRTNNDIIYVPKSDCSDVILINGTCAQLNAFIDGDSASKNYRGQIAPRNGGRAPWYNQLDLRWAVGLPAVGRARVDFTMDVLNFLNLLNSDWGWQYYPLFPSSSANGLLGYSTATGGSAIGVGGVDPATNKMRINLATITGPNFLGTFARDDTRSRWQAQWGLRVRF
jgi:hypothetical protein